MRQLLALALLAALAHAAGRTGWRTRMAAQETPAPEQALWEWAAANGADVSRIRFDGSGTTVAREPIAGGDWAYRLPHALILDAASASARDPRLARALPPGLDDKAELAAYVAWERAKGAGSFWAPYLAATPSLARLRAESMHFWWDYADAVFDEVGHGRMSRPADRALAGELEAALLALPRGLLPRGGLRERAAWALALVESRAVRFADGRLGMMPIQDKLNDNVLRVGMLRASPELGAGVHEGVVGYDAFAGDEVTAGLIPEDADARGLLFTYGFTIPERARLTLTLPGVGALRMTFAAPVPAEVLALPAGDPVRAEVRAAVAALLAGPGPTLADDEAFLEEFGAELAPAQLGVWEIRVAERRLLRAALAWL